MSSVDVFGTEKQGMMFSKQIHLTGLFQKQVIPWPQTSLWQVLCKNRVTQAIYQRDIL